MSDCNHSSDCHSSHWKSNITKTKTCHKKIKKETKLPFHEMIWNLISYIKSFKSHGYFRYTNLGFFCYGKTPRKPENLGSWGRPLFLALDLIGNTEAVSLVPQAPESMVHVISEIKRSKHFVKWIGIGNCKGILAGWWFLDIFYFHPDPWRNDPIWRSHIFSDGLVQPPSNLGNLGMFLWIIGNLEVKYLGKCCEKSWRRTQKKAAKEWYCTNLLKESGLLGGETSNIFYFHPENWGNDLIWRIFFKWVETTNQIAGCYFEMSGKILPVVRHKAVTVSFKIGNYYTPEN